jgi:hypothetical protein
VRTAIIEPTKEMINDWCEEIIQDNIAGIEKFDPT